MCRLALAEAAFAELLAGAPQLDVGAESASAGPAFAGVHDERAAAAAADAGIVLLPGGDAPSTGPPTLRPSTWCS